MLTTQRTGVCRINSSLRVTTQLERCRRSVGTPEVLFSGTYFDAGGTQWDVTRDGDRFLMLKPVAASDAAGREQARPQITVVQNWFEELRRLVPTN